MQSTTTTCITSHIVYTTLLIASLAIYFQWRAFPSCSQTAILNAGEDADYAGEFLYGHGRISEILRSHIGGMTPSKNALGSFPNDSTFFSASLSKMLNSDLQ